MKKIIQPVSFAITMALALVLINSAIANLMFTGTLTQFSPMATQAMLISTFIIMFISALLTKSPTMIAGPAPIIAILIGHIVNKLVSSQPSLMPSAALSHIVAIIVIIGITASLLLFVINQFKLVNYIRFIPVIVFEGFLAGVGLIMIKQIILASDLSSIISTPMLLAILVFGLIVLLCYFFNFLSAIVLSSALCLIAFYGYSWVSSPLPLALDSLTNASAIIPSASLNSALNWPLLLSYFFDYIVAALLIAIGLLVSLSCIELNSNSSIDTKKTIHVMALANLLSSFLGGISGYSYTEMTTLNNKATKNLPKSSILTSLLILPFILTNANFLQYIPTFIINGIGLFIGYRLILMGVAKYFKQGSVFNYTIVIVVMIACAFAGILIGALFGLVLSLIVFFVRFSQINAIKAVISGTNWHSNVERNEIERNLLANASDSIKIIFLQGYLFFGNNYTITEQIKQLLDDEEHPLNFVILDFRRVQTIEPIALDNLNALVAYAEKQNIALLCSRLNKSLLPISHLQLNQDDKSILTASFNSLDAAIEDCENKLIMRLMPMNPMSLPFIMESTFGSMDQAQMLLSYAKRMQVDEGEVIIHQGETPDSFYWLEQGTLDIVLDYQSEHEKKLRKITEGTFIGEMGIFSDNNRTATVIAASECVVYKFNDDALTELSRQQPELSNIIYQYIIKVLSDRLIHANQLINSVVN